MSAFLPDSDSEDELPPAWEERAAVDGSVYYVNHVTKGTQWTHPRTGKKKIVAGRLPKGWERQIDEEGCLLFVDTVSGRTTHTDPRLAFATELKDNKMDLRQRFDGSSTALQILLGCDLSGKTVFITGATNGIGYETARSLAQHGAHVIISGRSQQTCKQAQDKILAEKSTAHVSFVPMDLTSLASVRAGAQQIQLLHPKLDVIILNAGIMGIKWEMTQDGFETVFQVNYLSQFYLTLLLESCLKSGSRLVIVSSESHRMSTLNLGNLSLEKLSPSSGFLYWDIMAYNHSKLCNVLHGLELSQRLASRGVDVFSLHPGNLIYTGITKDSCFYRALFTLVRPFTKSLQQGAATTVYCAVAPEVSGFSGGYFNNCWLAKASGPGQNAALSRALWNLSIEILQQKGFPLPNLNNLQL